MKNEIFLQNYSLWPQKNNSKESLGPRTGVNIIKHFGPKIVFKIVENLFKRSGQKLYFRAQIEKKNFREFKKTLNTCYGHLYRCSFHSRSISLWEFAKNTLFRERKAIKRQIALLFVCQDCYLRDTIRPRARQLDHNMLVSYYHTLPRHLLILY